MSHSPLHLTARDFDAYAPEKATSNAYSRPRLEVKQRALGWARGVVARLGELGIAVDVHASDEHPSLRNKKRADCQWLFFWRDEAAREELWRLLDRRPIAAVIDDPSPYTRHAFLALRIDVQAVEVCFAVHPEATVDIDNLRALLATAEGGEADGAASAPVPLATELSAALRALPEQFLIGVGPEDRIACGSATPEAIRGMLERAAAGSVPLWIGWSVGRATAVEHADLLDEQLEDALIALAPIYGLVAWSRENDHIALDRRLEGAIEERARTHAEAEAQNQRWLADQAAARKRSMEEALARVDGARSPSQGPRRGPPRWPALAGSPSGSAPPAGSPAGGPPPAGAPGARPTLDSLFKPGRGAAPAVSSNGPAARRDGATRAPAAPPPSAPTLPPAEAEAKDDAAPARAAEASPPKAGTAIEKGARVRVLSGPFTDKLGLVGETDGRGGARVLLGLLSTRVDLTDLELVLEERDWPALQSSHRRPGPTAPRKAR